MNRELIINNIRQEIKKKNYSNDMLGFDQVKDHAKSDKNFIRESASINPQKHIQGNILIVLIKKIIRKLVRFYIVPIVNEQNTFNNVVVNILEENKDLQLQIEFLEKSIDELEKALRINT
jgi:hypothetical protein